ncbi:adenine nucleotide alpha hydrolases-like protein [Hypoxylon fragiforme]|uniref:adenine nucleotide alpha hydrolases-like protein n=1 Tax=Hypoxylon fragiforme TaxID=63214 RepID=UPI0020C65BD4|nr:adenine nucleotide alpha hydrolases-like protein [Hypoxylon fragiforme]KAI2613609.1 adenine nucleotide alpha hydrolases-like protein [Hypoxylon fragiforme]
MAANGPLNVVALVSGGKDSFYSILHCLANGHRVLALANLHPPLDAATTTSRAIAEPGHIAAQSGAATAVAALRNSPGHEAVPKREQHGAPVGAGAGDTGGSQDENGEEVADLNSFMYQTVGHQVIPLYSQVTGLPLFRQLIHGTAVDHGISYQAPNGGHDEQTEEDETESLVPLLRAVINAYPQVNALCTGAILSTYQRTRIESVALRLGLVPLAFLWQFPELPLPSAIPQAGSGEHKDDAQLLRDMAVTGLEARVVKVASAGLGEEFLWENVASETCVARIQRALRRFGSGGRGAVLGEGGEFETLVVDGPPSLFKGRIIIHDHDRRVVREGGGSAWLNIRQATVEMKADAEVASGTMDDHSIRVPSLLDPRFEIILQTLCDEPNDDELGYDPILLSQASSSPLPPSSLSRFGPTSSDQDWYFVGNSGSVEGQTARIVDEIRRRLDKETLPATAITNSIIVLRRMADFPTVNKLYGALFPGPNPPARVTISCGDLLPGDADITVFLSVQRCLKTKPDHRRGLHVQSRSYWAPANIGPYSQAISYPLLSDEIRGNNDESSSESPLAISIAGQISLVPSSMDLPLGASGNSNGNSSPLQITLALQHLWRIGIEMQVQWWSSAVAYFPRSSSVDDMKHNALLAATAWKAVHASIPKDPDAVDVDPWDQKYNPLYISLAGGDSGASAARPPLPDWDVVNGVDADDDDDDDSETQMKPLPFMFSAEVAELPRAAGVEWHAHLGFAKLNTGSVRLYSKIGSDGAPDLYHVVIQETGSDTFVQTLAVYPKDERVESLSFEDAIKYSAAAVEKSLTKLFINSDAFVHGTEGNDATVAAAAINPKLTYVDAETFNRCEGSRGAVIPCRSLWDARGVRLGMAGVYETRLSGRI